MIGLKLRSTAGRWIWCAAALAAPVSVGACNSGEEDGGTDAGAETLDEGVIAPAGFSATARGFIVHLQWSPGSGGKKVVGFELERNGKPFANEAATSTSLTDEDVRPGKTYSYEIRAKAEGEDSDWVSDEVHIRVPPLRDARVEGDFGAETHTISHSGYSSYEAPPFAWHFKPGCRHGACSVVWRDVTQKTVHAVLKRKDAHYSGDYHGYFFSSCHGTKSVSDVSVDLKVTKAKALAGEWRATKLEGTVENTEASQFGCVTGHAIVGVKAILRVAG